jgi:uncharacterized Fe-S cluster-containing radical SAM superfamily enzyme
LLFNLQKYFLAEEMPLSKQGDPRLYFTAFYFIKDLKKLQVIDEVSLAMEAGRGITYFHHYPL